MTARTLWIVGNLRPAEFAEPLSWVQSRSHTQVFLRAGQAIEAAAERRLEFPHTILLVQARPGEISLCEVEMLHAAAPLAMLVGLLGPWCEGELRSGQPWSGVSRVPWRDWRWRLARELGLEHDSRAVAPWLPRAANQSDRLQCSLNMPRGVRQLSGSAAIVTARRAIFESWQDALGTLGIRSAWQRFPEHLDTSPVDLQLIDGWQNTTNTFDEGKSLRRLLALHFPRPDDLSRAAAQGFAAVIAQPILLADLTEGLKKLLPSAAAPSRETAA